LVGQRVKDWVEPLLYRTMAMDYIPRDRGRPNYSVDALLSAIRAKPPAFFPRAVRHLAFPFRVASSGETRSPAEIILGVCTGIENLSMLDIPEALIPLVRSLPLKHLYAECGPLLSTLRTLPPTHTFFSRLTHLEVNSDSDDEVDLDNTCVALIALPQLTHLSFGHSGFIPIYSRLLVSCPSLRVLVYLGDPLSFEKRAEELARDVRFVVMFCKYYLEDWYMGIQRGADYWCRAERFIAKRRANEIDPLQYEICEDESEPASADYS
jgi:hypothetical protein